MMSKHTDALIEEAFAKTGYDNKYFPQYLAEAKRYYGGVHGEFDEDDCTEEDNPIYWSLRWANDYISFYVQEAEKGHCHTWSHFYALDRVVGSYDGDECSMIHNVLKNFSDVEEKNKELIIHAKSIHDDPIFIKYYKNLYDDFVEDIRKKAENYCKIFRNIISEGKSEFYAHAYADASCGLNYAEWCRDIYARAYELARKHGMQDVSSHMYGYDCIEAYGQGLWLQMEQYFDIYHEDWQKDFFFQLICDEYEKKHGVEMLGLRTKQLRIEFDEHYALLMKKHVL